MDEAARRQVAALTSACHGVRALKPDSSLLEVRTCGRLVVMDTPRQILSTGVFDFRSFWQSCSVENLVKNSWPRAMVVTCCGTSPWQALTGRNFSHILHLECMSQLQLGRDGVIASSAVSMATVVDCSLRFDANMGGSVREGSSAGANFAVGWLPGYSSYHAASWLSQVCLILNHKNTLE